MNNRKVMITNTKTRRVSPVGEVISSWRQRLHLAAAMVLMLVGMLVPQGAWADDKLDSIFIDNKCYYVLSSASDWLKFRDKVDESNGREVNAIMDADFWVYDAIALKSGVYYNGTFKNHR